MSAIRVGSYVTHSLRPGWGVGKVFGQSQRHILVGFSNLSESERFKRLEWRPGLLERAASVTSDVELDSWKVDCDSTCHYIGAVAKPKRMSKAALWSREEAMERFVRKYSNGFADAWYRSSHRDARLAQHKRFHELLPDARIRELAVDGPHIAAQHILTVLEMREKPLLSAASELPRVRAAMMRTEKMTPFLIALADVLEAEHPTRAQFAAYVSAFTALESPAKKNPLTWSIITALPFIAHPERHMFVKATAMRSAAAGLGFDINYKPAPNWETYERVLAFSNDLLAFIKPRSGEDMIDVHAFVTAIVET